MSDALIAPNSPSAQAKHPMAESDLRFRASLAALEAAKSVHPDRYAKARQQGRLLNLPAKALYAQKDDDPAPKTDENAALYRLLKLAHEGNAYAKDHLKRYGRTLAALANPELAAVSQDDTHALTRMEDALRQADFNKLSFGEKWANAWNAGWWQLRQASDVQLLKQQAQNGGLLDQYLAMDKEFAQYLAQGKRWDNPNKHLFGFEYQRASEEQRAQMRRVAECQIPDDWIDNNRTPLFIARRMVHVLLERYAPHPGNHHEHCPA